MCSWMKYAIPWWSELRSKTDRITYLLAVSTIFNTAFKSLLHARPLFQMGIDGLLLGRHPRWVDWSADLGLHTTLLSNPVPQKWPGGYTQRLLHIWTSTYWYEGLVYQGSPFLPSWQAVPRGHSNEHARYKDRVMRGNLQTPFLIL